MHKEGEREERTLGQFLLKSMEKVRHRRLISYSLSISRARSEADCATALRRRDTEYLRSIRSAVFLASKRNCSNPSLAVRQASFANLSKSRRKASALPEWMEEIGLWMRHWKACPVPASIKELGCECLCMRVGSWGCHDRAVAIITWTESQKLKLTSLPISYHHTSQQKSQQAAPKDYKFSFKKLNSQKDLFHFHKI